MKHLVDIPEAPKAIGTYSTAVQCGNLLFVSGQIAINPTDGSLATQSIDTQIKQCFENLQSVCRGAKVDLGQVAKLTIYMTDLSYFSQLNDILADYFSAPYPARVAVGVSQLPKGVDVEMDAIIHVGDEE